MSSRQNKIDAELRASACPRCGKVEVLQPIIYGLPNEDFDFENNISGGCLVGGYMPNIGCIECGWKGLQNPYTGEIIDKNAVDLEEDQPDTKACPGMSVGVNRFSGPGMLEKVRRKEVG